jgi:hypothetical protein
MSLAAPAVGLFLIAYSEYLSVRRDKKREYLEFAQALGRKIVVPGSVVSAVLAVWWQFDLPASTGLRWHPLGWIIPVGLLMLAWLASQAHARLSGYTLVGLGVAMDGLVGIWREIVRVAYLKPFHYAVSTYTVHPDLPSTVLFFSTVLGIGTLVGGYYLTLLYRAGRVEGTYTADTAVSRLGTAAVTVLVVWIGVFFVYGVAIWLREAFLA